MDRTDVAFIAGILAGLLVAVMFVLMMRPHCPTEDSCSADYQNGRWIVTEITP